MNWQDLHFFIVLVQQGTLSKCAEILDVQHTTVARRIKNLEKTLDVSLFHRIGKRYVLTQEGEAVYLKTQGLTDKISQVSRAAINLDKSSGIVTVSAPPLLAFEKIIKRLPEFYAVYPNIELIFNGDTQIIDLHNQEADIALRLQRPKRDDLVLRQLDKIQYSFFIHTELMARFDNCYQWVLFTGSKALLDWQTLKINMLQQATKSKQTTLSFVLQTNDLLIMKQAIKSKVGIGLLPEFMVQNDDGLQRLIHYKRFSLDNANNKDDFSYQRNLYLVLHEDMRHSARVRAVADWLATILQND